MVILLLLAALAGACAQQSDGPPEVDRQALLSNWRTFQGRDIIVSGVVVVGEGALMYLPQLPERPYNGRSVGTESMAIVPSLGMRETPGPLERAYLDRGEKAVWAKLRGRFDGAEKGQFGHMNSCRFQLELKHVIALRPATDADR